MVARSSRPELLFLAATLVLAVGIALVGGRLMGGGEGAGPDFRLASLDGPEMGPGDFRGQVVLLDFWATWCVPCRFQAQVLENLQPELEAEGIVILGVNVGEEPEVVREHLRHDPHPWPALLDPEDRLSGELGIVALPSLMILDPQGRVTYFEAGLLDEQDLRSKLREALGG